MTRDSAFYASHARRRSGSKRTDDDTRHQERRSTRQTGRLPRRDHPDRSAGAPPRDDDAPPEPGVSPGDAVRHLPERRSAHVHEQALFYDPPYDSLPADRLARRLVGHLKPSCGLRHETVALTPCNCFRLDFLVEAGDDVRGIERAGLLLGERPEAENAPALYDALVVGSDAVDVLYRFDPEGLAAHLSDALFLMSEHRPALFEHPERLRAVAPQRPCSGSLRGPELRFSYPTLRVEAEDGALPQRPESRPDLVVRRLSADEPAAWADDYRRALTHFRVPERQHRPPEALRRRAKAA
jgi:hypothetical protein